MKRFIFAFLFSLCFFACYNAVQAQACVAPVMPTGDGSSVMAYDESQVAMQYCKIEIRPSTSNFSVTAEIAVKNNGNEREIMFGMPYWFYNGLAYASNVSVSCNGSALKVTKTDAVRNDELGDDQIYYSSYYCWSANAAEGETVYMLITISVGTRSYVNNMQCIDVPLDLLRFWSEDSGKLEIVLDSAAVNIYSYDRTPSIRPSDIYDNGALRWNMDISSISNNLTVFHNIDNSVLYKFFTNVYVDGPEKTAADLFSSRQYDAAIAFIDENLSDNINFVFMKMVCLEKLGLKDAANDILKDIYDKDVCFSPNNEYDISEYVRKRMLYQYYNDIVGSSSNYEAKISILRNGIAALSESKSSIFISWANSEINTLSKLAAQTADDDPSENTGNTPSGNLSSNKWLSQISEPVIITVGIVMVVVVIFCLMGMFSGSRKKKVNKTHNIKR